MGKGCPAPSVECFLSTPAATLRAPMPRSVSRSHCGRSALLKGRFAAMAWIGAGSTPSMKSGLWPSRHLHCISPGGLPFRRKPLPGVRRLIRRKASAPRVQVRDGATFFGGQETPDVPGDRLHPGESRFLRRGGRQDIAPKPRGIRRQPQIEILRRVRSCRVPSAARLPCEVSSIANCLITDSGTPHSRGYSSNVRLDASSRNNCKAVAASTASPSPRVTVPRKKVPLRRKFPRARSGHPARRSWLHRPSRRSGAVDWTGALTPACPVSPGSPRAWAEPTKLKFHRHLIPQCRACVFCVAT